MHTLNTVPAPASSCPPMSAAPCCREWRPAQRLTGRRACSCNPLFGNLFLVRGTMASWLAWPRPSLNQSVVAAWTVPVATRPHERNMARGEATTQRGLRDRLALPCSTGRSTGPAVVGVATRSAASSTPMTPAQPGGNPCKLERREDGIVQGCLVHSFSGAPRPCHSCKWSQV